MYYLIVGVINAEDIRIELLDDPIKEFEHNDNDTLEYFVNLSEDSIIEFIKNHTTIFNTDKGVYKQLIDEKLHSLMEEEYHFDKKGEE